MTPSHELRMQLAQFIGTEHYHYTERYNWLVYTDGVKYFFEKAGGNGAYWLVEWFGQYLRTLRKQHSFLVIELIVQDDSSTFKFRVTDGNENELLNRNGDYTDLQKGYWKFFMQNGVLMLPSEY